MNWIAVMTDKGELTEEKEKEVVDILSHMSEIQEGITPPKQRCHNPLPESDCQIVIDLSKNLHPPIPQLRNHISDSCLPMDKVLNRNEAHGSPMIFKRTIFENDGVLAFLARNQWNINQGIGVRVFDSQGTEYEGMTLTNRSAEHRPQYALLGENWKAFCNANDYKNEVGNIIGLWLFTEDTKAGLCLAIMIASRKIKHGTAITNRSYFDDPLNKRRREDNDDDGDDQGGSSKKQSRYPARSSGSQRSVAIH